MPKEAFNKLKKISEILKSDKIIYDVQDKKLFSGEILKNRESK
jgi:hypothetical protein